MSDLTSLQQIRASLVALRGDADHFHVTLGDAITSVDALLPPPVPPAPAVKTRRVEPGQDVTDIINTTPPDVILVVAPGRYGRIVLPPHSFDGYRIIQCDGADYLGERADPKAASDRPVFHNPTRTDSKASIDIIGGRYRLQGLGATHANPAATIVDIGSPLATRIEDQPDAVSLECCAILGDPILGQKRGVGLYARTVRISGCAIVDIKYDGQDSQAIYGNNGSGPWTIDDNLLEASGENLMIGGDRAPIPNMVPENILIEGNTLRKPLEWRAQPWDVKNLLELKTGRKVIIRGNVLENCWLSNQTGYAVLFTPVNQRGDTPWVQVADVLFENNILRNVSSGINITGVHSDSAYVSERTTGIIIRNNLIVVDRVAWGGDGRALMIGGGPQNVVVARNTLISNGSSTFYTYRGRGYVPSEGCAFINNIFKHNRYGFMSEDTADNAVAAMALHYPGGLLEGNVIGNGISRLYPAANICPTMAEFAAEFENYAEGDYRLKPSTLRRAVGVDYALLPA
jgi:hypothetical protein